MIRNAEPRNDVARRVTRTRGRTRERNRDEVEKDERARRARTNCDDYERTRRRCVSRGDPNRFRFRAVGSKSEPPLRVRISRRRTTGVSRPRSRSRRACSTDAAFRPSVASWRFFSSLRSVATVISVGVVAPILASRTRFHAEGYRGGDEVRSSGRTRVKARVKAVQTSGVPPTRAVPEGELARDASRSVPGREVQAIYRRNLQLRHGRRRETRARETARRFVADLLARGNTRLDSSANARTRPWTQKRSG